jgi:Abnormal spindle-like microcephaly-assoc'd, ASPM-SPD-2-Hydin/Beta-propeller repeat
MQIVSRILLVFFLLGSSFLNGSASEVNSVGGTKSFSIPLTFERNDGQASRQYRFLSRHGGVEALFSADGIDFIVPGGRQEMRRLEMRPMASGNNTSVEAEQPLTGRANYFRGKQSDKWITAVPTFGQLRYTGMFPGIDLLFHGDDSSRQLEHDFVVAPGADPMSIRFVVRHADAMSLAVNGDLVIEVAGGKLLFHRPLAYQDTHKGRELVEAAFHVSSERVVSFAIGKYDHGRSLTIDPVLDFATYLGGRSGTDTIRSITSDANGNDYVTGSTSSTDFPIANALQPKCGGCDDTFGPKSDAFIAKFDPTGHTLIYSTYLGGSDVDEGHSIAVDGNGNVVIAGTTRSTDFPTAGKLSSTNPCCNNTVNFIASLDPTGASLRYSGTLGRTSYIDNNYPRALPASRVTFDSQGNAYVAGKTNDGNFPVTAGAYGGPVTPGPADDTLFIARVKADGSLGYAATIPERPSQAIASFQPIDLGSIAVDQTGAVTLGGTAGDNLTTTASTLSATFPNSTLPDNASAGFALRLNPAGSALLFSTYLPGTTKVNDVALDSSNNIYLVGSTLETALPVSANAFQKTKTGSAGISVWSGFVFRLSSDGKKTLGATYYGGVTPDETGSTYVQGLALDGKGNVTIGGSTGAADLPVRNPLVSLETETLLYQIDSDLFVAQLSPDLSTLQFGSFLNANDGGTEFEALATDPSGHILAAAATFSFAFPTTSGSFQPQAPTQESNPFSSKPLNVIASIDLSIPAPSVCFDTTNVSLGAVLVNTIGHATVNVTNCGNAALTLSGTTSSDPTVTGTQNCSNVAPGGVCQLQLAYGPLVSGPVQGALALSGNTAISPQFLTFRGSGAAPQVSFPFSVPFDDLLVGQTSAWLNISFDNFGDGNFILKSATISGDFKIVDNQCNSPVPPDGDCTVAITFSPTAIGARTGVLTLTDNMGTGVQTIQLSGNGITTAPVPTITQTPAILVGSKTAGINGTGFLPSSAVLWNGSPRTTHYATAGHLSVDLLPSDSQQLGEAQVVVTTPSPGGGTTDASTVTFYGQLKNIQIMNEVFEPHAQLIYAAVSKDSSTYANSVVAIDPVLMQVVKTIPTGNGPDAIAVSDDGSLLYVGLDDTYSVTQISLPGGAQNFTVVLPSPDASAYPNIVAGALKVVPGHPHAWLASLYMAESDGGVGIAVFDDSTVRPTIVDRTNSPNPKVDAFVFTSDPSVVYSTQLAQSPPDMSAFQIDASGIKFKAISQPAVGGGVLQSDGKQIYVSNGEVVDPSTLAIVSTYPQAGEAFNLDVANNRLFFTGSIPLNTRFGNVLPLTAVDRVSQNTIGHLWIPSFDNTYDVERFGANGIAIKEPYQIQFLETSLTGQSLPTPAVSVTPGSLSFTSQVQGTLSAAKQVTLTNTGKASLILLGSSTTGDFAESDNCGQTLAVAASCVINVTFTPTATGNRTGLLTISNNSSTGAQTVSLSGTGTALPPVLSASVSPASLSFAAQTQGTVSAAQQVTLKNTGNGALTIAGLTATDNFAATNTCSASLAAGESCVINVTFTPTSTGARNGLLTIADNAAAGPQTVSLSGTGTALPPVLSAIVSPGSLNFAAQTQGTSSTAQQVTLTNTGNAALTISGISVTGDFSETNTCGQGLAAAASCVIAVTFNPTAIDARTGFLTITDNASGSPQTVSLTGTGSAIAAPISIGSQSAGGNTVSVPSGTTATYNLTLSTNSYSGPVQLTCSGAPVNAACTINPASLGVTAGTPAQFVVTVTTEQTVSAELNGRPHPRQHNSSWDSRIAGMGLLTLLSLPAMMSMRRRGRWLAMMIALLSFSNIGVIGCGGGSSGGGPTTKQVMVPPGTYNLTVTAVAGSQTTTENLALTVK